ncbi:unnamed protein product [Orchesella dallaii]|uniref:RNA-directed DNA polymerase n=1 Tax=Orchesella dallaii TaxID=48710 RepID=A0ABP1Q117_9HEXA
MITKLGLDFSSNSIHSVVIGNTTSVQPLGECNIQFKLSNVPYAHSFLVMKDLPFNVILGADFIRKSGLVLDLSRGEYWTKARQHKRMTFTNANVLCSLQGLSDTQKAELDSVLTNFPDVVTNTIGCTQAVQCQIKVDGPPIAQKPYPVSYAKRKIIKQHIDKMLEQGIISRSESEWASPVTLQKQGNDYRFCIDYRKLNKVTKSDPYCIPRIDDLISRLGNAVYITKLDLKKGYWQIGMHPDSIEYTSFICHEGKYQFNRMPFGLKTAPSVFQRFMNKVLGHARGKFAEAYLDDILIISFSWTDHLEHIKYIFQRFREFNITINFDKCSFGETNVKYLGFLITPDGVATDPEKTTAISHYPHLKNWKDVKKFLGAVGWYRHYVPNFADKAEPLSRLLRNDVPFVWNEEQVNSFELLKNEICNAVVLNFPDFTRQFIVRTDASDLGLGAVLANIDADGFERPIAFASRTLTKTERAYHSNEKECLCIIWALKKWEAYLDGIEFILETDNRALVWLNSMKDVNSKFMRWSLKIQDFQPIIRHCPGRKNVVADALSRAPVGEEEEEDYKEVMDPPLQNASLSLFTAQLSTDLTLHKIQQAQQSDNEIQALLTDLPSDLMMDNGILFKLTKTQRKLPYIPKALRLDVLKYFHDSPQSGHMGFRKTLHRLLRRVYWVGMHEEIFAYIRSCPTCQIVKNPSSKPHGNLQSNKVHGPWDMLAIDLVGPLPITKNRKTQILCVVDHFTKWVELFAIRDAKAHTICKILEAEVFSRWGSPATLLSDNATNFRGKTFETLCRSWNVKHKFTTTYHPQANMSERVNRNIRAILTSYVGNKHNRWDDYLPYVSLALRTAVSDTTGYSPSMLNLGREISLPFDRSVEEYNDDFDSRIQYQSELVNKLSSVYALARLRIEKSQIQQKTYYDKRHKTFNPKVGDLVLLRTHYLSDKSKRFCKKFGYRWSGPCKIIRICSPVTFELVAVDNNETVGIHNAKNLRFYHDRPSFEPFAENEAAVSQTDLNIGDNTASQEQKRDMHGSIASRLKLRRRTCK